MSIVNISSENKSSGTDADFQVNLKKTLTKCIGLQLLNVTVPLSYDVINPDNEQVDIVVGGSVAGVSLENGTHSIDKLCEVLDEAINESFEPNLPYRRTEAQRALHVEARSHFINVGAEDFVDNDTGLLTDVSFRAIEPGMIVQWNSTNYIVAKFDRASNRMVLSIFGGSAIVLQGAVVGAPTPSTSQFASNVVNYTQEGTANTHPLVIYWAGVLAFRDVELNRILVTSTSLLTLRGEYISRRMCKTLGIEKDVNLSSIAASSLPVHHKNRHLANIITCPNLPEPAGPSMLFLRVSGDPLLDQQNSETSLNDRIPIPVDQAHGGIVHFENDSESDVIPFSVPCDVKNLKFRVEYGDDNTVVGGATNNLSGHHVYLRIKFFKMHQKHQQLGN